MSNRSGNNHASSLAALTLGAIGVVYGDIGTSVLYSIKEVFGSGLAEFTPDNVMGILSIFFGMLISFVVLVTAATVIASQALITGDFSVTKQVIQLGFLPRLQIHHTSEQDTGQIYMHPLWLCISATGIFFVIDLAFWNANMPKLADGGWFPLFLGSMIFILMLTWRDGRQLLHNTFRNEAIDLPSFLDALFIAPPNRVDGTAVFLTSEDGIVPNALLHNLKHNKVLHMQNLFVSVRSHEVPWIGKEKRAELVDLGNNCWQVKIHYGFKDNPNVPLALNLLSDQLGSINGITTSYFLSRDSIVPTVDGGMAQWCEKLFAQMYLNASATADFLNLPSNSVIETGSKIEI
jgi:KUP system potassium uptake protein